MSHNHHDVQKEVRRYFIVFAALLIGTVITVVISYLHLNLPLAITVALFVALVKASLVACYFMHLISEKRLVYIVLSFTVIFFFGLMLLPYAEYHSLPQGSEHHPFTIEKEKGGGHGHVS